MGCVIRALTRRSKKVPTWSPVTWDHVSVAINSCIHPAPRGIRLSVQAARIVFPVADREEIAAATTEILASGILTLGPYTRLFEAAFAAAHSPRTAEPPHAVARTPGVSTPAVLLHHLCPKPAEGQSRRETKRQP